MWVGVSEDQKIRTVGIHKVLSIYIYQKKTSAEQSLKAAGGTDVHCPTFPGVPAT